MIQQFAARIVAAATFACMIWSPGSFAQQRLYSLKELQQFAEQNFETIRLQRLTSDQASLRVSAAGAQRLPKIDADASYTWVSETSKIEFSLPGIFQRSIELGDGNNYSAGISISAPLFTGFKLSTAVEMQKEARAIAQQTLAGSIFEVRNTVTRYYLLAMLAQKNAQALETQMRLLGTTLEQAKQFVAQAQAIPYDTLVISTRLSQLRLERVNARYMRERALLVLMQISGVQEHIETESSPPPVDIDLSDSALLDLALQNRYEMKNLGSQRRIADLSIMSEQSAYYPTIAAFASYKYGKPGIDQFKNEWMDYFTAGVTLKWNLWSWNADKNRIEEQRIEVQKAALRENQFVNALRTQIATVVNDIRLARETMALVGIQIAQEEQKTAIVQARYGQGLATSTEVIDAETSLTSAKLKLEQATIDYLLKLNELAGLLGKEL